MATDSDRSGVILVRAWMHDGNLLARVQSSVSSDPEQRSVVAVGLDQIEKTVRGWLEDLAKTPP